MRRTLLITIALIAFTLTGLQNLKSYPYGAPADGRTGSPGDGGKTCYGGGCHSGAPAVTAGIITTNIPAEGYTAGTPYTITVSVPGSGKKGFNVSPQDSLGNFLGSIAAGTGTQVAGTKYVTHTAAKTTNPAVWTFTWTAPAKGTGNVNFYGAFAISTFTTKTCKLVVTEKAAATGMEENENISSFNLFPNPIVSQKLQLNYQLKTSGLVSVQLIDITGKLVSELSKENRESGVQNEVLELPELNNGIYFIRIQANNQTSTKKVWVQQ